LVRSYEDLHGGIGRAVFFRSERYRSRSVVGSLSAHLEVANVAVRLRDLSMSGLSFVAAEDSLGLDLGDVVELSLRLEEVEAFRGRVEVVRTERGQRGTMVGVRLVNGFIDIPKLRELHRSLEFRRNVAAAPKLLEAVPEDYRRTCADIAFFLTHWRQILDEREAELRAGDASHLEDELSAIALEVEPILRKEWRRLRMAANETVRPVYASPASTHAARLFTNRVITPHIKPAPIWWRSYAKPLGYPGDFQIMNYIYGEPPRGATLFGTVFHQLGLEERLASGIPGRMAVIRGRIEELVAECESRSHDVVRIASLAAGPAREVEEFLKGYTGGARIHWTLIDQDDRALSFANERVLRAAARHDGRMEVTCLYASFRQLISDPTVLARVEPQDMIYSAGFFDYLNKESAQNVIRNAYELLCPGGRLFFGNAMPAPDALWALDFVINWFVVLRTQEEMDALARETCSGATSAVFIDQEEEPVFCFAEIQRLRE
jgi:extracellular factor (EF) 3-hydroxypalmitic acid methyl ester biosynthesis protein